MLLHNFYLDLNFFLYLHGLLSDSITSEVLIIFGVVVISSLSLVVFSGQAGNLIGKGFLTGLGIAGGKYVGDKIISGITNSPGNSGGSSGGSTGGSSGSSGSNGSDSGSSGVNIGSSGSDSGKTGG